MTDWYDPGLARERTALAWNRTGLSFVVVGAVALRYLPVTVHLVPRFALGAALVALGAVAWAYGLVRARSGSAPRPAPRAVLRVLAYGTAFAAAVAILLTFTAPPS